MFVLLIIKHPNFKVPQMGIGPSNLVATGGGSRDHTIRFWDLNDGMPYFTLDTQSQVYI